MIVADVRGTFLHFLADNLPEAVAVVFMRTDPDNPGASLLAMNALNVSFDDIAMDEHVLDVSVSLDFIHEDEQTCVSWVISAFTLLSSAYYTTLYDYTDPSVPTATKKNLNWDRNLLFRKVDTDKYSHYSAVFSLAVQLP